MLFSSKEEATKNEQVAESGSLYMTLGQCHAKTDISSVPTLWQAYAEMIRTSFLSLAWLWSEKTRPCWLGSSFSVGYDTVLRKLLGPDPAREDSPFIISCFTTLLGTDTFLEMGLKLWSLCIMLIQS